MSLVKRIFLCLLAALYVFAGVNHFINPDQYVAMIPPYLPLPLQLVYLSGVIEFGLGILVLMPKYRNFAAWSIIAMLFAFMPVHIHMAMNPQLFPDIPEIGLYIRIPAQGLFMLWAWWFTGEPATKRA